MTDRMEELRSLTMNLIDRDLAIKEDMERLSLIANELPVGVWYCDSEGFSFFVNETWSKWAGLSPRECLGSGWLEAIAFEDKERCWKVWMSAVKNSYIYKDNYRVVNIKTGHERKCFAYGKRLANNFWVGLTIDLDEIGEHFYGNNR